MNKIKQSSQIIIYQSKDGKISVNTTFENNTVWLSIEQISILFGKSRSTVNEHILNIFNENELIKSDVVRKIGISDFSTKPTNFYNLDVIISVGYRVKSQQGTQFRIWATQRLREYIIKGFAINDDRFKSGESMNYFNQLQDKIREIRLSERFFYQKIKDIYTTSVDYNSKDEKTIEFFKIVQNKLIWAISNQTAAELVHKRVDSTQPLMGMQSLDKKNTNRIVKKDITISKNYLNKEEIKLLGLLVEQYLAFAETMAQQNTPMYMKDWSAKLDNILQLNGRELLDHAGKISRKQMLRKSDDEYKKYHKEQKKIEKRISLKELEEDILRVEKLKS